jgi:hypothetical protein
MLGGLVAFSLTMFANDLQKEVFAGLLEKVGVGAAAFYLDGCSLLRLDRQLMAARMLVAHALRETRASVEARILLMPPKEAAAVRTTFKVVKRWQRALHERAHRRALEKPEPIDTDFRDEVARFDEALKVFLELLPPVPTDATAEFLAYVETADSYAEEVAPSEEDVTVLRKFVEHVAPGPMAYYHDVLRLLDQRSKILLTRSHLIAHLLREADSGLRAVLVPDGFKADENKPENNHLQQVRAILEAYGVPSDDPVSAAWEAITTQDSNLAARAHHGGLEEPRKLDDEARALYHSIIDVFDTLLTRFEREFGKYLLRLDELLRRTEADAKDFLNNLPQTAPIYDYFFKRLDNPAWIEALSDSNVLRETPEPRKSGEFIEFPAWPQGDYLRRMLEAHPSLAPTIWPLLERAAASRNPNVHTEIAKAATFLPYDLRNAAALIEAKWLDGNGAFAWFLHAEALATLALKLAEDGATDTAIELVRVLVRFDVIADEDGDSEIRLRTDRLALETILQDVIPDLARMCGIPVLTVVGDMLATWRTVSDQHRQPPIDYSYIWRPAIEDHEQNRKGDLQDAMIDALRDGGASFAGTDGSRLREVVHYFLGRSWNVERRVAVHLAANGNDAGLAAEVLARPDVFDSNDCWHETQRLIATHWTKFSDAERSAVAAVILNVRDSAGEPHHDRQKRLVNRLPEPVPAELRSEAGMAATPSPDILMPFSGGFIEPKAPKSTDELALMEVDDILTFLREWQPRPIDFATMTQDSQGALAENLRSLVAMRPAEYAAAAEKFRGMHPIYVRAIVGGIAEAIQREARFEWGTVPNLLQWIIAQPRRVNDHRASPDYDDGANWVFVRLALLDFLENTIRRRLQTLEVAFMADLLQELARDPHPSPEDDRDYAGDMMERWFSNGMGTVRARAMNVLTLFGLVARSPEATELVTTVIGQHIEDDQSPSVRFSIGNVFVYLLRLDSKWAADRVAGLFDGPADRATPAWAGYLYNAITPEAAELLRPQYERAVASLEPTADRSRLSDWLVTHLVLLYAHGQIAMDADVLKLFFVNASANVRHHFLSIAGDHLSQYRSDEVILDRFMQLWQWRVESGAPHEELSAFEDWVSVNALPTEWLLDQLAALGERRVRFFSYMTLMNDDLPRLWPNDPRRAMIAARAITDAETDRVHINAARQGLHRLIELSYATDDATLRNEGRLLANIVSARGLTDFKEFV